MANTLAQVYKNVSRCKSCGSLKSNLSGCVNCENIKEKFSKICVVEDIADQWSIENSNIFKGYFHILGGTLSSVGQRKEDLLINSLADPSRIGTSSLSISTSALSIPNPNNAPIKCSIVETFTPYSLDIVVFNDVLLTFAKLG